MFHFCHLLSVVNIWYLFIIFSFSALVVWLASASMLTFLVALDIRRHEIIICCFPATLSFCFAFHFSRIIRWSHSWDIYSRSCWNIVIGSLQSICSSQDLSFQVFSYHWKILASIAAWTNKIECSMLLLINSTPPSSIYIFFLIFDIMIQNCISSTLMPSSMFNIRFVSLKVSFMLDSAWYFLFLKELLFWHKVYSSRIQLMMLFSICMIVCTWCKFHAFVFLYSNWFCWFSTLLILEYTS